MLKPPSLLVSSRDFFIVTILFFIILSFNLLFIYQEYRVFIKKEFFFCDVEVLRVYPKSRYTTIYAYIKSLDTHIFTTIYNKNREDIRVDNTIRLKLYPSSCSITFLDYLSSFYIKSKFISKKGSSGFIKRKLLEGIKLQHRDSQIVEFYQAIFLAYPISKEFRERVSLLGVSHLIALSGFHLGILFGVIFYILNPLYTKLQQKFFPYRYNIFDIGVISILILGLFLYLTSSPPSLVRAYVMFIVGWVGVILGFEIKSFSLLYIVILISLGLFVNFIFSISFWFSVIGVFYIFLILNTLRVKNRYILAVIVSFLIFILMVPIVHMIFPLTSRLQLLSPIISLIFVIFYPISILLHLFGIGDIFDRELIWLFNLDTAVSSSTLPLSIGLLYILLSIGVIFRQRLFWVVVIFAFLYTLYIYTIHF